MGFFSFLNKKKFYLHLLLAILLMLVLLWAVLKSLDSYTRQGEVYVVPDFVGQLHTDVMRNYGNNFNFILIDSIYQKDGLNGSVVLQNPSPGAKVKQGRNVYFTVVAQMPEQVYMPNLRNLSLRQAMVTLNTNGLHINELYFVDHFARNAVVEQEINGEVVEPETLVFKGTPIDLVVGNGGLNTKVAIPFLIGLKPDEAAWLLHASSLNVGEEIFFDGYDTTNARVYKTVPSILDNTTWPIGESVDLYYNLDESIDFDQLIDFMRNDSIDADSLRYLLNDYDF
jgi:eukaryotic-like serine/threonine-protein kinase